MINDKFYGALITKGLGYNPTIYLTSFFSLITVEVGPVPPGPEPSGGGGTSSGSIPYGNWQPYYDEDKRLVKITVNMGHKTWIEEYIVHKNRADVIVKIIGIINRIKARAQVSISSVTKIIAKVIAKFK